jgi:hypothetical protein
VTVRARDLILAAVAAALLAPAALGLKRTVTAQAWPEAIGAAVQSPAETRYWPEPNPSSSAPVTCSSASPVLVTVTARDGLSVCCG